MFLKLRLIINLKNNGFYKKYLDFKVGYYSYLNMGIHSYNRHLKKINTFCI